MEARLRGRAEIAFSANLVGFWSCAVRAVFGAVNHVSDGRIRARRYFNEQVR